MSKSVEKFHALNGATVSKEDLHKIISLAKEENNATIIYRCTRALEMFPKNEKECIVEIQQYKSALNAPRHSGSYKEALDDCGRLKKGWKFQNGNVVQVKEKPVITKAKSLKIKKKPVVEKITDDSKNVQNVAKIKSKYGVKKAKNRVQKVQKTRTFEKKSFAPEEWKNADTRKTTYLIKKYLKEKFGIKSTVKSEYFSGGSSLTIWYDFGPSQKIIESEIKRLQYGSFDGTIDMYSNSDEAERGIILDGYRLNEYKFVSVSREIPKSFDVELAKLISSVNSFEGVPSFDGNEKKLHDYFPQRFGEFWSWGQLARSKFWNANYVTQNESEIKDLEIHGNFNDYYLTYTVKGKKYDSRKPIIYPTKMIKERNITKNLINFIDYGKDNVAVIGYTGEISDYLEEEGGEYSNEIKFQGENHSGFIFHKSKADAVANILINYANEDKSARLSAPALTGIARAALDFYSKAKKKNKIKSKKALNGVSVQNATTTNSNLKKLENLGFVVANNTPKEASNIFILPNEIGSFLQKIQAHKALILIKGTKHTSKSQLAMQIANAFGENDMPVAYIDYEQGGLECKDTVDSVNRNTSDKGRKLIAIKGFLESPFEELKNYCNYVKVIVADSVTDLGISADQLNELRISFPDVIWCFISQVKENGEMYGGNKMAHNPTMIIKCHKSENPKLRYATLEKNRGNDLSLIYSIYYKKIVTSIEDIEKMANNSIQEDEPTVCPVEFSFQIQ